MFTKELRCHYQKNPLAEVICQLRFPEILKIAADRPADFQEAIRDIFPQYRRSEEHVPPKVSGFSGSLTLENQDPVINHHFITADGKYKINLTSKFISLTCYQYTDWETFAGKLDQPLAAFIQIYHPAYFERIGLRYLNFISRSALYLDGTPFRELIQPCYLGPLACTDISESNTNRCTVDFETAIRGGGRVKLHAGPGLVKQRNVSDKEIRFIFDQDVFILGNLPVNLSTGALQTIHHQADSIFRGAITDRLHDAMEPIAY